MAHRIKVFKNAEELKARLRDPRVIKGPLRNLLFHAATIGENQARESISGGTGIAERSIRRTVHTLDAKVYSLIARPRARSIEEGRKPGEVVPLMALVRWLTGRTRSFQPTEAEWKQAAHVQALIKARGAKGKRFIASARKKVAGEMPRLLKTMADEVEEMLAR